MEKKWFQSKTLWTNALVIAGAVLTDLANILGTEGTLSLVAVVNIVLRVVTKTALKK